MNASEKRKQLQSARLMREAAGEIRRLRTELKTFSSYYAHTERMLDLFEGGPRAETGMAGQGEDVAWHLMEAADDIDDPTASR